MKKNILIVTGILLTLTLVILYIMSFRKPPGNKQLSDKTFVVTAGGRGFDFGSEVVVDKSGSMYVLGSFQGEGRFGDLRIKSVGFSNTFLVKYSRNGDMEWIHTFGLPDNQLFTSTNIAIDDSSNIYIAGSGGRNAVFSDGVRLKTAGEHVIHGFIAKYNSKGKIQWAEAIPIKGQGTVSVNDLAVDKLGNTYLTGSFRDNIDYNNINIASHGDADIFVGKFNAKGKAEWIKSGGGIGFDSGKSLALDTKGNVYISGFYSYDSGFDHIHKPSAGQRDMFLAKYNTGGEIQWVQSAEGAGDEDGEKIVTDADDNIFVVGHLSGKTQFGDKSSAPVNNYSMFITKYTPDGKPLWVKSEDEKTFLTIENAAMDKKGALYITGYYSGLHKFGTIDKPNAGYGDIFVIKYDNNGNFLSVKTAGGKINDFGNGIAIDDSLRVYVTGSFESRVDFDDLTEFSSGDSDMYVWRYLQ
jgi:hypothetical protein